MVSRYCFVLNRSVVRLERSISIIASCPLILPWKSNTALRSPSDMPFSLDSSSSSAASSCCRCFLCLSSIGCPHSGQVAPESCLMDFFISFTLLMATLCSAALPSAMPLSLPNSLLLASLMSLISFSFFVIISFNSSKEVYVGMSGSRRSMVSSDACAACLSDSSLAACVLIFLICSLHHSSYAVNLSNDIVEFRKSRDSWVLRVERDLKLLNDITQSSSNIWRGMSNHSFSSMPCIDRLSEAMISSPSAVAVSGDCPYALISLRMYMRVFLQYTHVSTNACFLPHDMSDSLVLPRTDPNNPYIMASPMVVFPAPTAPLISHNPFIS